MDGKNDYLILQSSPGQEKLELLIFDRRGAEVYKNPEYDNTWNGVDFNGKSLPDDTYFYVVTSKDGTSLSGYIVVRR